MTCRCGHPRDVHAHYRAGCDCGACPCPRYRRPRRLGPAWSLRFLASLARDVGQPRR